MRYSKIAGERPFGLVARSALVAGLALSACTGIVGGNGTSSGQGSGVTGSGTLTGSGTGAGASNPGGGTTQAQALPPFSPAPESMHRLTKSQFQNSLTALLGNVTIGELDDDSYIGGFATVGAGSVVTSANGVQDYQIAIDAALDQVFADTARRSALVAPPSWLAYSPARTTRSSSCRETPTLSCAISRRTPWLRWLGRARPKARI